METWSNKTSLISAKLSPIKDFNKTDDKLYVHNKNNPSRRK